jgi:hypothetical protein
MHSLYSITKTIQIQDCVEVHYYALKLDVLHLNDWCGHNTHALCNDQGAKNLWRMPHVIFAFRQFPSHKRWKLNKLNTSTITTGDRDFADGQMSGPSAQRPPATGDGASHRHSWSYTDGHLRHNTGHRHRSLISRPRRASVTTPSSCVDGYPQHICGRRHIMLTVGPHFPLRYGACSYADGYPRHKYGRRHNI